ncbi:C1QL [Mytilus coruscus]|uniref:C1QL n=1 Tax=Mytilus coruscus TaxID=42192 RepID=A0A6J8DBK1_MYTCO|nr:C1QL [Mytilus coruscus]
MKGVFMTFIIHVILVDKILCLSESDSCDGEQCGSVISMPIMDNMKASLKADLDVSKMNKHLKAYIKQEIEIGVKTAMENLMKQMIENKTEKMNSEIMTMSEKTNIELTVRFNNAEERQKTKTDQMKQLIQNKSGEMLALFQDNEDKSQASFGVKMEEFEQKFEQKNRLNYAFFAHISSDKDNLKIGTIIIFNVVPLNVGSAYDGTTGKFTCKEDGIYMFSWTTLSNSKR